MTIAMTILNKYLEQYKNALNKSIIAFEGGEISEEIHNIHKCNLTNKIAELEAALNKLTDETKRIS